MKIRTKLTTGFIGIALLLGVIGYICIQTSQNALRKTIGESAVSTATGIIDQIDRTIHNRIELFEEYIRNSSLQEAVLKSNQEYTKLDNVQNYIDEMDQAWQAAPKEQITAFMQELMSNRTSKELTDKIEFYTDTYGYRVFAEVFLTNKYGANVAQTGKTTDFRQDDEEWWQRAREEGLYVENVEYDESANAYSVAICIRIDDRAGDFLGVTKAVLNVEEVIALIKEARQGSEYETASFELLTEEGKLIYDTKEFEVFASIPAIEFQCITEGTNEYFILKEPGEKNKLHGHAHSKGYADFMGLGWALVVEYETEEIFAPVVKLKYETLIISLAALVLAIFSGLFISKTISGRIGRLAFAAEKMGAGDLNTRTEIKSSDEIGKLSASFNKMAENISNTTTSIDNLNAANQQLSASEHQLKAANQQLQANEQQLRATNHQLQSEIADRKQMENKLRKSLDEVERFNRLMNGREEQIIEKKKEVNALLTELGRQPQYQSVLDDAETIVSSDKAK